ncbi:hypothetical protein HY484_02160 [Candidatus Woesearchaeota archaeon]|nr:hypothetical protein [Candidatus Woesearchaeota archaeon]
MIGIYHGPQGIYTAAEGIEQRIFQLNNYLLLFDEQVSLRVLRSSQSFVSLLRRPSELSSDRTSLNNLVETLTQQFFSSSVFVCGYDVVPRVFRVCCGVGEELSVKKSSSASSRVVFSPQPYDDFLDFVELCRPSHFGFVCNNNSALLTAPKVNFTAVPFLYSKELVPFANAVFSWFYTLCSSRPQDVACFVDNLCAFDLVSLFNDVKSSDNSQNCIKDAVSRLLIGTEYYSVYASLMRDCSWWSEQSLCEHISHLELENKGATRLVRRFSSLVRELEGYQKRGVNIAEKD